MSANQVPPIPAPGAKPVPVPITGDPAAPATVPAPGTVPAPSPVPANKPDHC